MRMPKGELMSTSPSDRLAHRHVDQRERVAVDLRARDVDAVELALEGAGARLRRAQRHVRAAARGAGRRLGDIDAEIG